MIFDDALPYSPSAAKTRVICVALDGSKNSEQAFDWCMQHLCRDSSESGGILDEIVLLNCRAPPPRLVIPSGEEMFAEAAVYSNDDYFKWMSEQAKLESHNMLKKYGYRVMEGNKGVVVRCLALVGDPRKELCDVAKELKAEMFVVGTRGMGLIQKAMIGSVSDHLLHHLECPVIVVHERHASQ
ncbi:UNVERIFIED_CONTAM: hypothetical protein HDU68_011277 [Siphonaria sp. JEL0065]|nr:hypothetical protein HDU68_011277 [Siphonaria sp. JEL0065]